jgi:hypothetical protein
MYSAASTAEEGGRPKRESNREVEVGITHCGRATGGRRGERGEQENTRWKDEGAGKKRWMACTDKGKNDGKLMHTTKSTKLAKTTVLILHLCLLSAPTHFAGHSLMKHG